MQTAQINPYYNVSYSVTDSRGNARALFQENALCTKLLKLGVLSPLWLTKWHAPLLALVFGSYSDTKVVRNLITTVGKALIAGRINGSGSPAVATYVAVGTGTTSAAAGDTALQTESATAGLSRANGTASLVTTTTTNDTAQVTYAFTVTGTVAVTEAGLLNASSSGTLLARQVFSAVNVVNGDTLTITWRIAVA